MKFILLLIGCVFFLTGSYAIFLLQPANLEDLLLCLPILPLALGGLGLILYKMWGLVLTNIGLLLATVSVISEWVTFRFLFWYAAGVNVFIKEDALSELAFNLFNARGIIINVAGPLSDQENFDQHFGEGILAIITINAVGILALILLNIIWTSSKFWEMEPRIREEPESTKQTD